MLFRICALFALLTLPLLPRADAAPVVAAQAWLLIDAGSGARLDVARASGTFRVEIALDAA